MYLQIPGVPDSARGGANRRGGGRRWDAQGNHGHHLGDATAARDRCGCGGGWVRRRRSPGTRHTGEAAKPRPTTGSRSTGGARRSTHEGDRWLGWVVEVGLGTAWG
uniref:Uncharacterized protein n=1 Tax=Oryza glumipatula TaxID=40148 RepID=A0A0D9YF05_9ORYZ